MNLQKGKEPRLIGAHWLDDRSIIGFLNLWWLCSQASKIRRRPQAKKKIDDYSEQQGVHQTTPGRVQEADDDVETYPDDKKPARPIEATKHKSSANNRENVGDEVACRFKRMLRVEFGKPLGGGSVHQRPQVGESQNAAERYEYPTDDRNRARTLVHLVLRFDFGRRISCAKYH